MRSLLAFSAALALAACGSFAVPAPPARAVAPPAFGEAFWKHWGDGRAELAGYELTIPRYGEARRGTAVAIFVTETFSETARVKADPGKHPDSDTYPVIKLNLLQGFQTGIYDYDLMTSAFVALAPHGTRVAGLPVKVSFSAQEWCGHVYSQVLFDRTGVRRTVHSYFDGEADRADTLPARDGGVAEDALLLWARGLAAPEVPPGGRATVPMLGSLRTARLTHAPEAWVEAVLSREAGTASIRVPAGTFEVRTARAEAAGRTWTFDVEAAPPHRVVRWRTSEGEEAALLGAERTAYWKQNAEGFERELGRLGLTPRPPRTP
jgi:hypothetical protein